LGHVEYRNFFAGSERSRRVYTSVKGSFKRKTIADRRRVARECADGGSLRVDRDVGFRILPPGTIPEAAEVVDSCRELIDGMGTEELTWQFRQQLSMGNLKMHTLTLDSPFLRFALRPDVLASVSAYLGVVPILFNVDVWYSQHSEGLQNTQRFHCDWGATSQVKIFVHATDVDADNGPLVVLPADKSKAIRSRLKYNYVKRWTVDDDQIFSEFGNEAERPLTGEAGTVAMVDTSRCFHYGSRVGPDSAPRVVGVLQFFTPLAFKVPWNSRRAGPLRHLAAPEMSELQRLALGA